MNWARLGQLDLNLLYTLHTFVERGSVAQAARALGRSQPAISARLHQLEEDLGVRLFERAGRRLKLTPVGRIIDAEARTLLAGVHRILDRARSSGTEPTGLLRIGALPTVGVFVLAPVLSRFTRGLPAVQIELHYGLTDNQLELLFGGDLDMVVSVGPPPDAKRIDVTILGEATPVLTVQAGVEGLPRGVVAPSRLAKLELVGFGRIGDPFFDAVWSFLEEHGLERRVRLTVPHIQTLKALILTGAGVSILPDYTVIEPTFETRRVKGLDFKQPIWMAVRDSSRDVPIVEQLSRVLRAQNISASPGAL